MRALILAAGRGERMRPLTDSTPKPLLAVGGKPLIVWHLERLAAAGVRDIVINLAWLGERLEAALGDGHRWGVRIAYSREGQALETAGGIARALPLLTADGTDPNPFLVVSGDTWSDFDYGRARSVGPQLQASGARCWCVMVANPSHHGRGDFRLVGGRLRLAVPSDAALDAAPEVAPEVARAPLTDTTLTYAGIGLYSPAGFAQLDPNRKAALRPWLEAAIRDDAALGEFHGGAWHDIGTVERLESLDRALCRPGTA